MANVVGNSNVLIGHGIERNKIASMVSYISNDKYISDYLGIPIAMVKRVRAAMPSKKVGPDFPKGSNGEPMDPINAMDIPRKNAAIGSAALLDAMMRYYANRKKRINDSAA